ncbi:DNA starvation/stationary phase protection protein [Paenibacillus macquariensis subsp. defensor]|uniref:Starvation-inducible DNA-binding protein n=1 Tax=Paenibacillus macquariensis TaxID=948756 RepID=A0ABY1JWX8_9BACL|nr:DNA starvation/stationary phase protection protein [Paenibacillus macquariensis]MEC0089403.1 DNA starvation/stationary phase protection protein [Paenibacillus macquariensis]OAB33209.1 DNA starvation/stationary phase protection protein [Paenibacillus macquariensis subsp. macquariensis]OAB34354.1 DNA starvation/stationary phase protection protein [Paenibacillus macquariensis subsp. defensor]SIQ92004.1 starvation-inducible DNA-binding protein [Paenibacillus macquariensis]
MTKSTSTTQKTTLEQVLNQQVANLNVLYVKLHNYHWYVRGEKFFTLHVKFEEIYNDVTLKMDEVAERLLTLKGSPVATMKEFLDITTIQEADGKEDASKMVQNLIEDLATVAEELEEGIDLAENAHDHVTGDILITIKGDFEKHMWMLRALQG